MIKKIFLLLLILMSMANTAGCANAVRVDGPYEGQIIDAETGQPIEGVVILGVWNKEMPTVAGAVSSFYDAAETTSNSNGDFIIKGQGMLVASNVLPVSLIIFKAGYQYESGLWPSLRKYAKNIRWEGEKAIIPLKKLSLRERKLYTLPNYPSDAPREKIKLLLDEINKDRLERGLETVN